MNRTRTGWVDPRIEELQVEQVRRYMLAHGWQIQPNARTEVIVFQGPLADDGQPLVQILCSSKQISDYWLRLEDLLEALSHFEERPCVEILNDMLASAASNGPVQPPAHPGVDAATTDRQRT
jgi:hypothetical protein